MSSESRFSCRKEKIGDNSYMEIETKIFDTKRVRKVLDKKGIEPKRVCDVVDYLFDIAHFSAKNWRFSYPG